MRKILLLDQLRKVGLSIAALGAFAALLAIAPFRDHGRETPDRKPIRKPAIHPPATAAGESPAFSINGVPVAFAEEKIPPCDATQWHPLKEGYCPGDCTVLTEQRGDGNALFSWLDQGGAMPDAQLAGDVHALSLRCGPPGSPGTVSHLTILSAAGLDDLSFPQAGPVAPRTAPIPLLAGATELLKLTAEGTSVFIDRPRFADTALDELQLELMSRGWWPVIPPGREPPEGPPARILVRGRELCIATVRTGGEEELLISAYSPIGWAPETPR